MLATAVVFGLQASTSANTFTVTNTGDSGTGSLRWAIQRANNHAGPDRIVFKPALAGPVIRPTEPLPRLTDNATRTGG